MSVDVVQEGGAGEEGEAGQQRGIEGRGERRRRQVREGWRGGEEE